jgi:hypothetical protein
MCERVFRQTLEKRHARKLTIPLSLSYFENMIRDAITTEAEPVGDDPETVRWRVRVNGWRKGPRWWLEDHWGPPPGQVSRQIGQTGNDGRRLERLGAASRTGDS